MKNKNLKITNGILIIWLISLLSTFSIGIIGFKNMSSMNTNLNSMYKEQLLGIQDLGGAYGNFGAMRVAFTKLLDRKYDESYLTSIEDNNKIFQANLKKYSETGMDDKTTAQLEKTNKDYDEYYKYVNIVKLAKQENKEVPSEYISTLAKAGDEVLKDITSMIEYTSVQAQDMYNKNVDQYNSTKTMFVIILVLAVIILSALTFGVFTIIKSSIKNFTAILKSLSAGDFTLDIAKNETNEFGFMKKELSLTIDSISDILKIIKSNTGLMTDQTASLAAISEEMTASSHEVANAVEGVSAGSASQATELVQMSNSLNSFGTAIDTIVLSVSNVDKNANNVNNMAKNSNKQLENLFTSINNISSSFKDVSTKILELGTSVKKVNEIIELINSIADQTELLALNAAIEAARAGESGKGFAVVADEVRKLAEQSKNSSSEINTLLSLISAETNGVITTTDKVDAELEDQVSVINNSIASFKDIIDAIERMLPLISNAASETNKINKEKTEIISKIKTASAVAATNSTSAEHISASTQQMNDSSQEVARSAEKLANVATETLEEVNRFKL